MLWFQTFTVTARQVYRFWPFTMTGGDTKRLHGLDERISIDDYLRAIQFYGQIIRNNV